LRLGPSTLRSVRRLTPKGGALADSNSGLRLPGHGGHQ